MAQTAAMSTDAAAAGLAATPGRVGEARRSILWPIHWHLCGELLLQLQAECLPCWAGLCAALGLSVEPQMTSSCWLMVQIWGQNFIHYGSARRNAPPPYVDPWDLLNEPTMDPMIPLK